MESGVLNAQPVAQSVLSGPPLDPAVGDRIEEIVRQWADDQPDAPAVRWRGEQLSYRQLVDRAAGFATALAASGVRPGDVVAMQLSRSPDLICLILAVLQLRAVYTLMPLEWPVARRRDVLDLTGAVLCLSREEDAFEWTRPMMTVERLSGTERDTLPADRTRDDGGLGDLTAGCCIFFTSGSTGMPKCAVAPHLGLIRAAKDPEVGFDTSTVMHVSSSMAWDLFGFEVWSALLNGGTCVLRAGDYFSYDDLRDAVQLGANTAFLTPTIFNGAVRDDPDSLAGLRLIFVGGDRLSAKPVVDFLTRFPGSRVVNLYGPVEATVLITRHLMTTPEDVGTDVPIGVPVPATGIYLLDDDGRVVPVGETGEIAASGVGLSLGYLGNPEETERSFRRLPVLADGGEVRLYLTGDFGSIDERGLLRFHGRRDRQVKLQGVRVEPHEVERVVGEQPGVSAAVAVPIPIGSARPDGIAVVYATGESETPRPEDVRRAVAAALPAAFVPRVVHRVEELPLNVNRKLDRARIAELIEGQSGADETNRARTPLMTLLVELEALTGQAASVDSDVVELGLTSITALKLISRMRAIHGIRLPMNVIFRSRTPGAIVAWIDEN